MLRSTSARRRIAWVARFVALITIVVLGYFVWVAPSAHIRGGLMGLTGALFLVVPPIRQAFRNHLFGGLTRPDTENLPPELVREAEWLQVKAFCEFSWVDVVCLILGPLLLAGGYLVDVVYEEHPSCPGGSNACIEVGQPSLSMHKEPGHSTK
jgi:hypothetical protein